jgi:hypothetical protein
MVIVIKIIMNTFLALLYKFDLYGRSVASLNVNGKSTHRTPVGGAVGLIVSVLISIFFGQRSVKMVNRGNTSREEVMQSINLMADDTPKVNFKDY